MDSIINEVISMEKFSEKVKNALKDYYEKDAVVSINKYTKNNGIVLTGVSIIRNRNNISPTIYLDDYYVKYNDGMSFGDIIINIIKLYEDNLVNGSFNLENYRDYNNVKGQIVYKLVNKEMNKEQLKDIPYFEFLDMAIVFYYLIEDGLFSNATILIYNSHLKIWNVTKEMLYDVAKENTPKLLKSKMNNMQEILSQILFEKLKNKYEMSDYEIEDELVQDVLGELLGNNNNSEYVPMYVLTNCKNSFGAACILYDDLLDDFAEELDSNLIILPSSIHEVIIIPSIELNDFDNLFSMVKDVNQSQLARSEILSDSVYIYDRVSKSIGYLNNFAYQARA